MTNEHYYSKHPQVASDRHTWSATIGSKSFEFTTDAGVFSKTRIDQGSALLAVTAGESTLQPGPILDMGCGYGPVGIYLAQAFPKHMVEMVDINERAVALSQENAEKNGVAEQTTIYESTIFSEVSTQDFSLIVSNPPIRAGKKVVHQILTESYDHLQPGGRLQIVIQKKQGAPSAKKKMAAVFGNVERIALKKGYWILESVK